MQNQLLFCVFSDILDFAFSVAGEGGEVVVDLLELGEEVGEGIFPVFGGFGGERTLSIDGRKLFLFFFGAQRTQFNFLSHYLRLKFVYVFVFFV